MKDAPAGIARLSLKWTIIRDLDKARESGYGSGCSLAGSRGNLKGSLRRVDKR